MTNLASPEHLAQFKKMLSFLGEISDASWQAFSERLASHTLGKGELLTEKDQIENNIYFINKGAIRVYVVHEGKELSTNFRFENQFTSSVTSFLLREPSQYNIKTLVATNFLVISHEDLYWLYDNFLDINVLGRVVMERLLIDKRQRELDFFTLSAEDRYYKLLKEHPDYVLQIPLKHIASFLGITAESLSRIRAKKGSSTTA
ncbi:MAG: Crp/Fnr family transcriptional regulator [Saprospiraceae bacterium]|nr:Crp/Fnr family transcriptional regulator [Saprospiraceae bacterium]